MGAVITEPTHLPALQTPERFTRETPASVEPTIDYVVTKILRFAIEKFL
jgi:carbamoylphosphate synthase large subunit